MSSNDADSEGGMSERYLEWGQTPFDDLSREELLRQCQRLYAATLSLTSVVRMSRHGQEHSPYWGPGGAGAHALEKGEQALRAAQCDFNSESIYRAFFRYAVDLLFESKDEMRLGFDWYLCTVCKQMSGSSLPKQTNRVGLPCPSRAYQPCPGTLRLLTWDDLKPAPGSCELCAEQDTGQVPARSPEDSEFDRALAELEFPLEPLQVYDSNSWRRVGLNSRYREVMVPCNLSDGQPDIAGIAVLRALVAAFNAMLARRPIP